MTHIEEIRKKVESYGTNTQSQCCKDRAYLLSELEEAVKIIRQTVLLTNAEITNARIEFLNRFPEGK